MLLSVPLYDSLAFQASVVLPSLQVRVRPTGRLTSEDGESPPMNASTAGILCLCDERGVLRPYCWLYLRCVVAAGTWGDVPCNISVVLYSHRALTVSFAAPPSARFWTPVAVRGILYFPACKRCDLLWLFSCAMQYVVEVSSSPDFTNETTVAAPPSPATTVLMSGLQTAQSYYTRVAVVPPAFSSMTLPAGAEFPVLWSVAPGCSCADEALPSSACVSSATPVVTQPMLPVLESVVVVGNALPGAGGGVIAITGRFLGTDAHVIRLRYVGGLDGQLVREYFASGCTVAIPNSKVVCTSVPGVGGNYRFQLIVDGGASALSSEMFSYAAPAVLSLSGPATSSAPTGVREPCKIHGGPAWMQMLLLLALCVDRAVR